MSEPSPVQPSTASASAGASLRVPTLALCVAAVAAGASGAFLGTLLTRALGWPEAPRAFAGAVIGGGVVAGVGLLAALFMHVSVNGATGPRAQQAANQAVLGGTTIRLLGLMFVGLGASLLTDLDRPMWLGLLAGGMLALVVDTLILTKALARQGG
jgi:hypothetical protein